MCVVLLGWWRDYNSFSPRRSPYGHHPGWVSRKCETRDSIKVLSKLYNTKRRFEYDMKDLRQTGSYVRYMKKLGWEVATISGVYCYLKKIPLMGVHIKIQRPGKIIDAKKLTLLARKRKAYVVYIEPLTKFQKKYYLNHGLKETKATSLPSKTIRIDLTKDTEKLLADMHNKTRYNIGLAKRRGVRIKRSDEIQQFADFWQMCARKRKMYLSQKREIKQIYEAFGKDARLFFACLENELIGAIMTLSTKTTSYYMYAASNNLGNKLFAPTLLVWEAIRYSKRKGAKIFDFGGIFDERYPLKTWKGFTRFKKGFGGKEFEYEGPLRRYFLPI